MKITQYGEQQVQSAVVAGPTASTLPVGAFSGSNVAAVAGNLAENMKKIDDRVGTTKAEEALVGFERDKNALLLDYGSKQGRDAYDGSKDAIAALQKLQQTYSAGINHDAGRKAFDRVATNHVTDGMSRIGAHAMSGLKQWEGKTLDARIENLGEDISLNRNDPKKVDISLHNLLVAVNEKADHDGVPQDDPIRSEMVQNAQAAAAQGLIRASLADGSRSGKAALDKYGPLLEGGEAAAFKEMITKKAEVEKNKADNDYAISTADRLAKQYASNPENIQHDKINAEIDKIKDPERRNKLRIQVDHITSSITRDHNAQMAQYTHEASDANMNGQSIQIWAAENPDKWAKLPTDEKRKLEEGKYITTNPVVLNGLYGLPREQMLKIDINDPKLVGQIDPQDKRAFQSAQKTMREGGGTDWTVTKAQVINQNVERLFGASKDRSKTTDEAVLQFTLKLQDRVDSEAARKGGKLTPTEMDEVIKASTNKVVIEYSAWNKFDKNIDVRNTPLNELDALNYSKRYFGNERMGDVYDIMQKMKAEGAPINADTLYSRVKRELTNGK